MTTKILTLILLLNIKHFIADFVLQNDKIASNKGKNLYFLLLHAFHHSILTFIILLILNFNFTFSLFVSFSEIFTHSFFDFLKANKKFFGRYIYPSKLYFVFFGLDQFLHQINYLVMVKFLI